MESKKHLNGRANPKSRMNKKYVRIRQMILITAMLFAKMANAQTERNTYQKALQTTVDTVYLYQTVDEKPLFAEKAPFDKGGFYDYLQENSCNCLFESFGHGTVCVNNKLYNNRSRNTLINAKIIKKADPLLDIEALRVVNSSPKWTPGKQNGIAVKVKYTLPIRAKYLGGCAVPQAWMEECRKCMQEKSMQAK